MYGKTGKAKAEISGKKQNTQKRTRWKCQSWKIDELNLPSRFNDRMELMEKRVNELEGGSM